VSPVAEDYRGPEWSDEKLKEWVDFYRRERATALTNPTDRPSTIEFCEFRMDAMLTELERRERLAHQLRHDPRGPRWSNTGAARRADLIELAQDLKQAWPIDSFLTHLMRVDLIPAGKNRWRCRCFTGLHEDRNPSMVAYGDDGHVFCHACRYHGDVIAITQTYFGLTSFAEALRYLAAATAGEVRP